MIRTKRIYGEHGATMVETALFLPIFLFCVFFALFLGFAYNAKSSLQYSVGSVRLAFTRGDSTRVGRDDIISTVNDWRQGRANRLIELLTHNLAPADTNLNWYDHQAVQVFGNNDAFGANLDFKSLDDRYIYAQIYTLQTMLQSVGDVKFPCDPTQADGSGCMRCWNLNPMSDNTDLAAPPPLGPPPGSPDYNQLYVGIRCQYSIGGSLMKPLHALANLMSGSMNGYQPLVITQQRFFEAGI